MVRTTKSAVVLGGFLATIVWGMQRVETVGSAIRTSNIEGVKCRIIPDKTAFAPDESPHAKIRVEGSDSNDVWLAHAIHPDFQLRVDDRWYHWVGPEWVDAFGRFNQARWVKKVGGFLTVPLDAWCWETPDTNEPLQWKEGDHRIRVSWPGCKGPIEQRGKYPKQKILLVSNTATIRIESGDRSRIDKRTDRVAWLFDEYLHAPKLTALQTEAGMRTHLRSHQGWYPKYEWSDIPELMKLADRSQNAEVVPMNLISSFMQGQCREGMIALWLIEGLRCKEASQVAMRDQGKEMPRLHYLVPLNPMCRRQETSFDEAQVSAEIHESVLKSYQRWWKYVGSMSPEEASAYDPLADTDLRWFTGRTIGKPLPEDA